MLGLRHPRRKIIAGEPGHVVGWKEGGGAHRDALITETEAERGGEAAIRTVPYAEAGG